MGDGDILLLIVIDKWPFAKCMRQGSVKDVPLGGKSSAPVEILQCVYGWGIFQNRPLYCQHFMMILRIFLVELSMGQSSKGWSWKAVISMSDRICSPGLSDFDRLKTHINNTQKSRCTTWTIIWARDWMFWVSAVISFYGFTVLFWMFPKHKFWS